MSAKLIDGLTPIIGFSDKLKVWLRSQDRSDALPQNRMIVYCQNSDGVGITHLECASHYSSTWTIEEYRLKAGCLISSLCVSVDSLCLCGEINLENVHHRDTERAHLRALLKVGD